MMKDKPDVSDRSWVASLPDHAIFEIDDVMHDSLGSGLRRALSDERWRRHAKPLTNWPIESGGEAVKLDFVLFCGRHDQTTTIEAYRARTPQDPNHQPTRILDNKLECSCGWREGLDSNGPKQWRHSEFWWPIVTEWRSKKLAKPHYVVCRYAKRNVNSPEHAPRSVYDTDNGPTIGSCICGSWPHQGDLELVPVS